MERHVFDGDDKVVGTRIDALETRDASQFFGTGVHVGHQEESALFEAQERVEHHLEVSDAFGE